MPKYRVLLVEDDTLLRIGLKSMIQMRGNYVVGDDVSSGEEAVRLFKLKPADFVLLDIRLPDIPGTEVLRRIKEFCPAAQVIVLTACDDKELIYASLDYGANGYVLKGSNPEELFLAMQYALSDDLFISPRLAKHLVEAYLLVNRTRNSLPTLQKLTVREKEIVRLVTSGMKSREIAETLNISIKTVNKHRSNILGKLGVRNCSVLRHEVFHIAGDTEA